MNATTIAKTRHQKRHGSAATIPNLKILAKNPELAAAFAVLNAAPGDNGGRGDGLRGQKMARHDAAVVVAKFHSRQIVARNVSPYAGVKSIVMDACHPLSDCPKELGVFVSLESEFADFSGDSRRVHYGEEHCAYLRRQLERRIVDEARNFAMTDI